MSRRWLLLFMASAVFLATCSFVRLLMDDLTCYDTALRLHGVFQAARRVDGQARLVHDGAVAAVEGGGLRVEIPDRVTLATPVDGVVRFRGGRSHGDARAWLCASSATGSGWWVLPDGGVEGRSILADWLLGGFR